MNMRSLQRSERPKDHVASRSGSKANQCTVVVDVVSPGIRHRLRGVLGGKMSGVPVRPNKASTAYRYGSGGVL